MSESQSSLENRQAELAELRRRSRELEAEILEEAASQPWSLAGFYTMYYATAGFLLGLVAASASLLANVIGASIVGKNPLELIRVYLTFPLGERALAVTGVENVYAIDNGVIVACGVCLYLATGMIMGVPFHVILARFTANATIVQRAAFAAALGIFLWALMFYGILAWLQPLVCGGSWITDNEYLPWWVGAVTHVVFGLTMVLVYPLGQYMPYRSPVDNETAEESTDS